MGGDGIGEGINMRKTDLFKERFGAVVDGRIPNVVGGRIQNALGLIA